MKAGDQVTWRHEPRGGYGYIYPVDGTVIRVTPKRVIIRVARRDGTLVERSVTPDRIVDRNQPATPATPAWWQGRR